MGGRILSWVFQSDSLQRGMRFWLMEWMGYNSNIVTMED